jgi:Amidohydrolase
MTAHQMPNYNSLLEHFQEVPIFDTHSHIGWMQKYKAFTNIPSIIASLLATGIPDTNLRNKNFDQQVSYIQQHGERYQNIWNYRIILKSLKDLYGNSNADIIRGINANRNQEKFKQVKDIMDNANVKVIVADLWADMPKQEEKWFNTAYHLDSGGYINAKWDGDLEEALEEETEFLEENAHKLFQTFKYSGAYRRILQFDEIRDEVAEKIFAKKLKDRSPKEIMQLEDYLFFYYIDMARELKIPIQIHTGFGWGPINLPEVSVLNLWPVFKKTEHWDVKYCIFHGSYPYISEMGYTAAVFKNVFLDFNCLASLSPHVMKRALSEWIDIVPMDKIMCGSDNVMEWIHAAAGAHRRMLAEVLSEKIQRDYMDYEVAINVGKKILHDNAADLIRKE